MLKHNYHTHTTYCKHAKSTPEEVINIAIENGLETIGISEHIHLEHYIGNYRLKDHETALQYIREVNELKEKYKDKIEVLCGFEAEGIHPYKHYRLTEWIKYVKSLPGVDYIILGHHNYKDGGHIFEVTPSREIMEDYLDAMEEVVASGSLLFIAHPDGYYQGHGENANKMEMEWIAHRIADISLKYDCPLALNVNGAYIDRLYPNEHFWEIMSQRGVKMIIELDAHGFGPWKEENYQKAVAIANKFGLKPLEKLDV